MCLLGITLGPLTKFAPLKVLRITFKRMKRTCKTLAFIESLSSVPKDRCHVQLADKYLSHKVF